MRVSYGSVVVRDEDFALLSGPHFFNDAIVMFYQEEIRRHLVSFEKAESLWSGLACNVEDAILFLDPATVFLIRSFAEQGAIDMVVEMIEPLHLVSRKLILVPVNDNPNLESVGGTHWSLLVFDLHRNVVGYYDSVVSYGFRTCRTVYRAMLHLLGWKESESTFQSMSCPQQTNGYDCGVFCVRFQEVVAKQYARTGEFPSEEELKEAFQMSSDEFRESLRHRLLELDSLNST